MEINRKKFKAEWFKFEGDVEFQIKPFKFSKFNMNDVSKALLDKFYSCLVGWKGITEDGKELKCNPENKQLLFDYYETIREFVFLKIKEQQEALDKNLKN